MSKYFFEKEYNIFKPEVSPHRLSLIQDIFHPVLYILPFSPWKFT